MAQKTAFRKSFWQKKFENEAKEVVADWIKKEFLIVDYSKLYVKWFAFIPQGYKCMVGSQTYKNLYFEITKNNVTEEMTCCCYNRFEYFVNPGVEQNMDILIAPPTESQ